MRKNLFQLALFGVLLIPSVSFALAEEGSLTERNAKENLPPSQSDHDARPPVAMPGGMDGGTVTQAGVGGVMAFGRAGVVELGGTAGFNAAEGLQTLSLSPTIGWFLADNFELSALVAFQWNNVQNIDSTFATALIEPSYHLPLSNTMFVYAGVGAGVSYLTGQGTGFAMAPRFGMNFLVGRSGVLTPSAFFSYSTIGISGTTQAQTLSVRGAYGLQIGYTVML